MADLSNLKITVDVSDVIKATEALDHLTVAAERAQVAISRLSPANHSGASIGADLESAMRALMQKHQRPGGILNPI